MPYRRIADRFSLSSPFSGWWRTSPARMAVAVFLLVLAGIGGVACDLFSSGSDNRPPTAEIVAPPEGSSFSVGGGIRFKGQVSDPDGNLTGGSTRWRSSLDGRIGLGSETASADLSPGDHTIRLTATDGKGASASASISLTIEARPSPSELPYRIERTFSNLQFDRPTNMEPSSDGERFYLTEQKGLIQVFPSEATATGSQVFLDLTDRVLLRDEHTAEGLLGFALDPEFAQNGYFYVLYTTEGPDGGRSYTPDTETGIRSVLSRFEAAGPESAKPGSEKVLLELDQPYRFHNGGQLAFGPDGGRDGNLYVSFGDGGSAGDPEDRAQDASSLYGTILRIDPDGSTGDRAYGIPPENPFAGSTDGRAEVFAYGLRNIWRFSFGSDGRLWGGDVGQGKWEEVDIIEKGKNYGWDQREGMHCFEPETGCQTNGLTSPIWEYDRSAGRSVNGGYVYRGSRLPDLEGTYVYGDHVSARVWSLSFSGTYATGNRLIAENPSLGRTDTQGGVASFAEGADGHLYLLSLNGKIYHLTPRNGAP